MELKETKNSSISNRIGLQSNLSSADSTGSEINSLIQSSGTLPARSSIDESEYLLSYNTLPMNGPKEIQSSFGAKLISDLANSFTENHETECFNSSSSEAINH